MTKWDKFYDWVMNPKNKKEYYDSEVYYCSHQGRVHMDYVFNGEDEVRVFTCDNCGEELDL